MLAYIFRRLLLIIPTLFGILLINFLIIQAAPGGPVEQMIAKLEGFDGATSRIAGGGDQGLRPCAIPGAMSRMAESQAVGGTAHRCREQCRSGTAGCR